MIRLTALFICILLLAISCQADKKDSAIIKTETTVDNKGFDADLAKKLGADEYGMHQYVMAFLKAGPNRDQTEKEAQELQRAHLDNINKLAEEGKLIVAGPFLDDGELRGIYIFDVKTTDEAKALTETDPAIKAGRLVMELHPWYGSAALMQVGDVHKRISKTEI